MKDTGCIDKVLSGKHVLVIGKTGSGKTYWMSKVAEERLKTFIFVNPQEERVVEKITTFHTDYESEVIEALEDGHRKIEFIPAENDIEAIGQLETIRRDLWEVAGEANLLENQWWINFICDEANLYAWKGSRNDLDNFAKRGRRYGIRCFFLTQRPQNISSGIVNNMDYQVIFESGSYESPYFRNYKIPIEEHKSWLERPFSYVVYDSVNITRCDPI